MENSDTRHKTIKSTTSQKNNDMKREMMLETLRIQRLRLEAEKRKGKEERKKQKENHKKNDAKNKYHTWSWKNTWYHRSRGSSSHLNFNPTPEAPDGLVADEAYLSAWNDGAN